MTGGSALATAGTGGAAIPVTAETGVIGVALVVHGAITSANGAVNLISQKGRVSGANSSSKSGGEGSKGGGKNSAHTNQKAKESAAQKYETAKGNLNELKSKPNKTQEDKAQIKKLEGQVKQLQGKKTSLAKIIAGMQKEIDNE